MRVFITGATGFIGGHLARHFAARGDTVIALVRSPQKAGRLPEGVEIVAGDLSIFADPATRLPPCDVVIHLAGVVTAADPAQYAAINRDAVGHLVDCLARQDWTPRRLLFASSLAAAGPSTPGRPWTEADALAPIDPYGEAKAAAEALVARAPFPVTTFRPPLVFGPGDTATLTLYQAARSGVGVRVTGAPQRLSFVDVRDAVEGVARMADDAREGHHTYYLSHPDTTDLVQLWAALGRAAGRRVRVLPLPRWLLFVASRAATVGAAITGLRNQLDDKQYRQMIAPAFVCDSRALRGDLGWAPRRGLDDALAHAAAGYRAAGVLRG